jgi:hypothetical protein
MTDQARPDERFHHTARSRKQQPAVNLACDIFDFLKQLQNLSWSLEHDPDGSELSAAWKIWP